MKKIYMKPSLLVERFTTEEIMDKVTGKTNVLSSVTQDLEGNVGVIHFDAPGSDNVLNSIDYNQFLN